MKFVLVRGRRATTAGAAAATARALHTVTEIYRVVCNCDVYSVSFKRDTVKWKIERCPVP